MLKAVYKHVAGRELPHRNITSTAIKAYYPNFPPGQVRTLVSHVLCMIPEYHVACVINGPSTTIPILSQDIEENLPPLESYALPEGSGLTDVRVKDHKARSL